MSAEAAVVAALIAWAQPTCGATRVEVPWLGVDLARHTAAQTIVWTGDPCKGRPTLQLSFADAAGAPHRFTVHPQLALWVPGAIAGEAARRGETVSVAHGDVAIHQVTGRLVVGNGPYVARMGIATGAALTELVVEAPPDARVGAILPVRYTRGPVVVSVDGRLLADAHVGDRVRFVNLATQLAGEGTLVAPDQIELR